MGMELHELTAKNQNLAGPLQKCPICRASWVEGEVFCRRCGADMTWILDAQRLGRTLLLRALAALACGDPRRAAAWARRARLVHSTPFSREVARFLE
ncbi:MAG: hypothetical protein HQL84_02685 [Magnetococcales bacterium]|nr:hypothetical protein [Magnetococcales bacterium]MBF0148932.1 hypothetical protein [Magnetococcales bacterium]